MTEIQDPQALRRLIEHTALKPGTTPRDVVQLCREAEEYGFGAVCVPSSLVPLARNYLGEPDPDNPPVKLVTVAGFPLGNASTSAKAAEAVQALHDGADHVDMVIHLGRLLGGLKFGEHAGRSRLMRMVIEDIRDVRDAMKSLSPRAELKVIIETGHLDEDGICLACDAVEQGGAEWVKTSTGFGPRGASIEDVLLMRAAVEGRLRIKAAGGIRTLDQMHAFAAAGADAIGCSAAPTVFQPLSPGLAA